MKYKLLGKSGLRVSEFALGATRVEHTQEAIDAQEVMLDLDHINQLNEVAAISSVIYLF